MFGVVKKQIAFVRWGQLRSSDVLVMFQGKDCSCNSKRVRRGRRKIKKKKKRKKKNVIWSQFELVITKTTFSKTH